MRSQKEERVDRDGFLVTDVSALRIASLEQVIGSQARTIELLRKKLAHCRQNRKKS